MDRMIIRQRVGRAMGQPVSVMENSEAYREFYNYLGHVYEETATVYSTRLGQVRYRAVLRELARFARSGARLLDVGCNDGVYTIPYCRLGGTAHGIDISSALIEKARMKAVGLPATFQVADIETTELHADYDLVLFSEVLEHVRNPGSAMRNVVAAIRPGGHLLMTTPLPYSGFTEYFRRLVARRPLVQQMEFENFGARYRHDGYYPLALKDWIEGFGLRCVKLRTLERHLTRTSPMQLILGDRNLQLHQKL